MTAPENEPTWPPLHDAVTTAPIDHPDRAELLAAMATARLSQFEREGATANLDDAIRACQAALRETRQGRPDRAEYLMFLGSCLGMRFELAGQMQDLDAAIRASQEAVSTVRTGDPRCSGYLAAYCAARFTRFEQTNDVADLDAAIRAGRAALAAAPAAHHDRVIYEFLLNHAERARPDRIQTPAETGAASSTTPHDEDRSTEPWV